MKENQRGITLIALVITIIVLLILAGISITMLTDQNGIMELAEQARERTETATEDEEQKIARMELIIEEKINGIPEGKVAKIGNTYYSSVAEAIGTVTDSTQTTIFLVADIKENIVIPQGKNIILNLNEKTISPVDNVQLATITSSGILKLVGSGNITATLYSALQAYQGTIILQGDFNISNTNSNFAAIWNTYGEIYVNDGTYNLSSAGSAFNYGFGLECYENQNTLLQINGGTIISTNCATIYNAQYSTLNIKGGTISSSIGDSIVYNAGIATITGGTLNNNHLGTNYSTIYNDTTGTLNVSAGVNIQNKSEATGNDNADSNAYEISTKYNASITVDSTLNNLRIYTFPDDS